MNISKPSIFSTRATTPGMDLLLKFQHNAQKFHRPQIVLKRKRLLKLRHMREIPHHIRFWVIISGETRDASSSNHNQNFLDQISCYFEQVFSLAEMVVNTPTSPPPHSKCAGGGGLVGRMDAPNQPPPHLKYPGGLVGRMDGPNQAPPPNLRGSKG